MNKLHYDENGYIINTSLWEIEEQNDAREYIDGCDIVLEIGGRYGTVSTIINNLLNNKKNHVVVEPDNTVINALLRNRDEHNCEFKIYNGIITNRKTNVKINPGGYGTTTIESDDGSSGIDKITYKDLCQKYNLMFNTLVVDCEGCFCDVLDSIGDDIVNFNKIFLELDQENLCNYNDAEKKLSKHFYKIKSGFHSIYINKNSAINRTENNSNIIFFSCLLSLFILILSIIIFAIYTRVQSSRGQK